MMSISLPKRSEESFKTFVTPGMLFEAFNFEYFGPINGHKLNHLIDILNNIKMLKEPVLLHVTTEKGKGYLPAEKNPVYFHGVGCFEVETGISNGTQTNAPTYTEVFGKTMVKLAETNEKIVAVTAAMPEGTGLIKFSEAIPERFFRCGNCRTAWCHLCRRYWPQKDSSRLSPSIQPFCSGPMIRFFTMSALNLLPVVFAIDRGGIVGEDGSTHHGLFDFSFLRSLPNMVVMAPKDENELCAMLATAVAHSGPVSLRYPRGAGWGVDIDSKWPPLPIGKAEVLTHGDDVLILAIGRTVGEALQAREILLKEGITTTLVNARFIKPMDSDTICSLAKMIPRIVTVEENVLQGGFGSAVLECLSDNAVSGYRLTRLGISDTFVEHGPQSLLRSK